MKPFFSLMAIYLSTVYMSTYSMIGWRCCLSEQQPDSQKPVSIHNTTHSRTSGQIENVKERLFYLRQRAFPTGKIDRQALNKATQHSAVMLVPRKNLFIENVAPTQKWEYFGPHNLLSSQQMYNGNQTISGRVNGIAYAGLHNSEAYYIATAGGGVWKTINDGKDWQPISDNWGTLQISCIAVDPNNPQVIYVGTGDYDQYGYNGIGLRKSTDGGLIWQDLGQEKGLNEKPFANTNISRILIDPDDSRLVTVATGRGTPWQGHLWWSPDAGKTWIKKPASPAGRETSWSDLAYSMPDSAHRRYYYAAGHYHEFWRSMDRGEKWEDLTPRLAACLTNNDDAAGMRIATSAVDPRTIYLLCGSDNKILRSDDAGEHWIDITGNYPDPMRSDDEWSQAWYDLDIACISRMIDGVRKDVLYAGITTLSESIGGSRVWNNIALSRRQDARTHSDQHCIAIDPMDSNRALVGTDGGVYKTTYSLTTDSFDFSSLNNALGTVMFFKAAFHPTDENYMIGGTQDNGIIQAGSDVNGKYWSIAISGDGGDCLVNPIHPDFQYVSLSKSHEFYYTTDSWKSDTPYSDWGDDTIAYVPPIAMDQNSPNLIYFGTNYLWCFDQNTSQWQPRLGNQPLAATFKEDPGYVQCIAVAPTDGFYLYTGSNHGELWMTTDRGTTWKQINRGLDDKNSLPYRAITSISISPSKPNSILVGLSGTGTGHLWRCDDTSVEDSKRVWQDVSGPRDQQGNPKPEALPDISLNTIARHFADPENSYFVGTDVGVFYTDDGGKTWSNATQPLGLPNVQVNDLKAIPGTGYLNAATYGRGIWRLRLAPPVSKFQAHH